MPYCLHASNKTFLIQKNIFINILKFIFKCVLRDLRRVSIKKTNNFHRLSVLRLKRFSSLFYKAFLFSSSKSFRLSDLWQVMLEISEIDVYSIFIVLCTLSNGWLGLLEVRKRLDGHSKLLEFHFLPFSITFLYCTLRLWHITIMFEEQYVIM